jgi:CDP-glucose 4,6-dehydratase
VYGYALPPPGEPNLFQVADVGHGVSSEIGDVRNLELLSDTLRRQQPETVFHLAAQALVRESYHDPIETYSTNVMGTVNLLQAIRSVDSVRSLVIITSDKCYENREWVWGYRENEPMGGFDPYSSSKGCAELVTSAMRRSFFDRETSAAIATVRAGNVIGGGDWAADRLIPDLLTAFQQRRPAEIRNPAALRPWQHVLEPLGGYLLLAQLLYETGQKFASGWNFGPALGDARPVSWIADRLAAIWGEDAQWQSDAHQHPHEAQLLRLDCSKALTELGWVPKLSLEDSLRFTVAWYRAWAAGGDMRAFSLEQINAYQEIGKE